MPPVEFRTSWLFPKYKGKRKPFPNQALIFDALRAGALTGGGAVYQGGKGSGKTIVGGAVIIWAHHVPKWQGTTSLIGRETYPSLLTSTADEFLQMVDRLPPGLVKRITRPSKNSMGVVEWTVGGRTLLCSLSNSDVWESANLGLAWVDEAHRQNPTICGDLETRLRQNVGPRAIIYTTNPAGRGFLYNKAHEDGSDARQAAARGEDFPWVWVEASTEDNPTLADDYHARLRRRYGYMTPAYKRWVLGQSTALEGSVFTEFDDDPAHVVHVVPPFDLPRDWTRGRGLDYGKVNPTAVVWGAFDPKGNLWIDKLHYAPAKPEDRENWTIARHAEVILDYDEVFEPSLFPADPTIFLKNRERESSGTAFSVADEFDDHGVELYPANNNREQGLNRLLDLVALDDQLVHPVTMRAPSPRLFVMDKVENEPLLREFMALQWARQEGSSEAGRPDDCQKKDDHTYDATRYLAMDHESGVATKRRQSYPRKELATQVVGSRGRSRRY